jgi:hypothetical protein
MGCLNCVERAQLLKEAMEAIRHGDMLVYHEKMVEVLKSGVDDIKSLVLPGQTKVHKQLAEARQAFHKGDLETYMKLTRAATKDSK